MAKIEKFPMSLKHAQEIIKKATVHIPADLGFERPDQDWQHAVTDRQIRRVIEAGVILGKPAIDDHGNIVCRMFRFGAGEEVTITIALIGDESKGWDLFVTDLEKSDG